MLQNKYLQEKLKANFCNIILSRMDRSDVSHQNEKLL